MKAPRPSCSRVRSRAAITTLREANQSPDWEGLCGTFFSNAAHASLICSVVVIIIGRFLLSLEGP